MPLVCPVEAGCAKQTLTELAANPTESLLGTDLLITTYSMVPRLEWLCSIAWNWVVLDEAGKLTSKNKVLLALVEHGKILTSKNLTLISSLYPQYFENKAIVLHKTTNEYFQYLFEPWDYCTKLVRNSQIHLQYMYATGLRRHCSTRSFRNTGLSFRLNLPAMAGIYQPTSQKNSTSS